MCIIKKEGILQKMNKEELLKIKEKALEEHIPIIMDDTLETIKKYISNHKLNSILEIGTAVGYSAICFTQFSLFYVYY